MKFPKVYAACALLVWVFFFLGGWALFDLHNHLYAAILGYAFLLAVFVSVVLALYEKIGALEKKVQQLEQATCHDETAPRKDA